MLLCLKKNLTRFKVRFFKKINYKKRKKRSVWMLQSAILLLRFPSVFLPSSIPRHTWCVPNMVKWRKCEIIINNINKFPRFCTQQSDVNSALNYLHSYLIYFLTDVKHNNKLSDNLAKSTQWVQCTAVMGGVQFVWSMQQRIWDAQQEDAIQRCLKATEKKKKIIKKYSTGVNWRNEGLRNSNEDIKY